MKKPISSLLAISIFLVCSCSKAQDANPAADKAQAGIASNAADADPLSFLPEVVAKIGDEKITGAEIKAEFRPFITMMKQRGEFEKVPPDIWKREVLNGINELVVSKLLSNLAETNGYKPDTAGAEEEFKKITEKVPPEQLAETFKQQGITPEAVKQKIATGLAIKKWIEEKVIPGINVSEEEAEKFYNANLDRFKKPEMIRASHILISTDPIDPEKSKSMSEDDKNKASDEMKKKALQKAQEILAKLKKGEDFAKLASENSTCPSKEKGGDLGTFPKGKMVPEFEKAAFSMKPGEMSDVVETKYGYHIIKLVEKNDAGTVPFSEVKNFIIENLKKQKFGETMQGIIEAEKKNKKVEILVN